METTLAGDLGWRGVACTLIESGDGAIYQAKMDMVGIRTMEYCRRWGIVPWVEQGGYNRDFPQDCAWAIVDIVHAKAEALYERRLVLVRPDGQVCWRADAQPEDAARVIDTVRGAR